MRWSVTERDAGFPDVAIRRSIWFLVWIAFSTVSSVSSPSDAWFQHPSLMQYLPSLSCPILKARSSILHPVHHFTFALCLLRDPLSLSWFEHPSLLHRFIFAPCLMNTPPSLAWFLHPSLLHRFISILAPCLMHTPPFTTRFLHPSLLHRLIFAPCLTHTPPLMTWFLLLQQHFFILHCCIVSFWSLPRAWCTLLLL